MCSQQAEHVSSTAKAWLKAHTAENCTIYEEKVTNWHMLCLQNQSFTLSEETLHFDSLCCREIETVKVIPWAQTFKVSSCICCMCVCIHTSVIVRTILNWRKREHMRTVRASTLLFDGLLQWLTFEGFISRKQYTVGLKLSSTLY